MVVRGPAIRRSRGLPIFDFGFSILDWCWDGQSAVGGRSFVLRPSSFVPRAQRCEVDALLEGGYYTYDGDGHQADEVIDDGESLARVDGLAEGYQHAHYSGLKGAYVPGS